MNTTSGKIILHAYAALFPFCTRDDIICDARRQEIDDCKNFKVRQAKFYSWKLLEIAAKQTFGLELHELEVEKGSNGKWRCDEFEFSLSHSGSVVAVAVSNRPVGVDVEKADLSRFDERLNRRIMTEAESEFVKTLSLKEQQRYANIIWTRKEALFKLLGTNGFIAKSIETTCADCITKTVTADGASYYMTVVSEHIDNAVFQGVNVDIFSL